MDFEAAFGPDHEIGFGNFLLNGHLSGEALIDLFGRPAARRQPLLLRSGRARHTNRGVKLRFGTGFEQERDHDHAERAALAPPRFDLSMPALANRRVEDLFELFARCLVREYQPGELVPAQRPLRTEQFRAERGSDLGQGRLPGPYDLAREVIRIDHRDVTGAQEIRTRGLAHADTAGETEDEHEESLQGKERKEHREAKKIAQFSESRESHLSFSHGPRADSEVHKF
jgi:hypothetical protein